MPTDVPFHALGKPRHLDPGYHEAKQKEGIVKRYLAFRNRHLCSRCGQRFYGDTVEPDGCRDPDCPMLERV